MSIVLEPDLRTEIGRYNRERLCADKGAICYAPTKSMYFGRDGTVTACSSSRKTAYGAWPGQSVEDLWFNSRNRHSMADSMAGNRLLQGCSICADQLRAGSFSTLKARDFDHLASKVSWLSKLTKPSAAEYPVRMDFELSNKCNLECTMCSGFFSSSIRANRDQLPAYEPAYNGEFVEQLKPFIPHLKESKFLGGEPFLIDIYYSVWEQFIELNPDCHITIVSNGTVFTPKVRRVLDKLNCDVVVSIDSLDKRTFESIRKNSVFERVMTNLDSMIEINRSHGRPTSLSVSPIQANWREMPEILTWATNRQLRIAFTKVSTPIELSLRSAPMEVLDEILAVYGNVPEVSGDPVAERNNRAFADLRRHIALWRNEGNSVAHASGGLLQIQVATAIELRRSIYLRLRGKVCTRCKQFRDGDVPFSNLVLPALVNVLVAEQPLPAEVLAALKMEGLPAINQRLTYYFQAMDVLGTALRSEGILPAGNHQVDTFATYIDFLTRSYTAQSLSAILETSLAQPHHLLQLLSCNSAAELQSTVVAVHAPDLVPETIIAPARQTHPSRW